MQRGYFTLSTSIFYSRTNSNFQAPNQIARSVSLEHWNTFLAFVLFLPFAEGRTLAIDCHFAQFYFARSPPKPEGRDIHTSSTFSPVSFSIGSGGRTIAMRCWKHAPHTHFPAYETTMHAVYLRKVNTTYTLPGIRQIRMSRISGLRLPTFKTPVMSLVQGAWGMQVGSSSALWHQGCPAPRQRSTPT